MSDQSSTSNENNNVVTKEEFSELIGVVKQLASTQELTKTQFSTFQQSVLDKLNKTVEDTQHKAGPIDEEDKADWWEGFDVDSKKAVKSEISAQFSGLESKFDKKLKEEKDKLKKELAESTSRKEIQQKYDSLAIKEFPQIQDQTHPLYKEWQRLWVEKKNEDPDWETRPSSVYDTARIAYANLVNRGDIVPESFKDEAMRLISVQDGFMPTPRGKPPVKAEELTKEQMFMVQKFGISADRYLKQLQKPFGAPTH